MCMNMCHVKVCCTFVNISADQSCLTTVSDKSAWQDKRVSDKTRECLTRQESVWPSERLTRMVLNDLERASNSSIWNHLIFTYCIILYYIIIYSLFGSVWGLLLRFSVSDACAFCALSVCLWSFLCVQALSEVCSGWMFQETKWLRSAHCTHLHAAMFALCSCLLYPFMVFYDILW
jgi:hypothetical protein